MARVVLTLDEPRPGAHGHMAGLQVRVHEMAAALARAGHGVRVVSPAEAAHGVAADVWVTTPRLVAALAPRIDARALVVDGYESPFGSFLAQAAALLPRIGARAVRDYRRTIVELLAALARAESVLCANESQRVSYGTILAMLGPIGPRTPDLDLVMCVSSGAPPAPPARPLDEVPHDPVLLWCGGAYPWFDVDTYLAALPAVAARVPQVRLRFAGIDGVAGDPAALPQAQRMRDVVAASPALARRAEFVPWRAYAERGALYVGADVGVCTHADHLETRLAMRTRVIDMIWGGLPLVVSAGDETSRLVDAHGLGRVVSPGDAAALAEAVVALLSEPAARRAASTRARALATGDLSWDRQVAPLARYCAEVAAGRVARRPAVDAAEAIARLNDGRARRLEDATRSLVWRAGNVWRRLGAGMRLVPRRADA